MSALSTIAAAIASLDADFGAAQDSYEKKLDEQARAMVRAFDGATYDDYQTGKGEWVTKYQQARNCKEATAQNRWSSMVGRMEKSAGFEAPRKPTKAAEVKREQRADKSAQVADILKTHKTAVDILKAAEKNPTQAAVYMDAAKELAKQTQKQATADAKERVKALKAAIAEGVKGLTLAQLEKVAKLVQSMQPAPKHDADDEPEVTEAIDELEALPVGEVTEADDVNPLTVLADGNPDSPLSAMQSAMAKALAPTMI